MEIIEWVKTLLTQYGLINVVIMCLVILLTNLVKKPIVEKADDFVETAKKLTGIDVDKSVITSNIIYIPIGFSFVLYFLYTLITVKFNFYAVDWVQLISNSVIYGMLSMSIYEIGKSKIKAYLTKKDYKDAKAKIAELTSVVMPDAEEDDLLQMVSDTQEQIAESSDVKTDETAAQKSEENTAVVQLGSISATQKK